MKRRSPPWGAIEAFIVATRVGSFKEAASQLGLSPPAFSRRIQALEDHLNVKLFDRTAALPVMTVAGERYLTRLQPGYDAIRAATDWMAPDADKRPLRIGVSQSFALGWLVPRLPRFYAQTSGIELVLQTRGNKFDLRGGAADVGIFYGRGDWDHLASQKLFGLNAAVLTAPSLASGMPLPQKLEDLCGHRLLDLTDPPNQWDEWLAFAGYRGPRPDHRLTFDSYQVMYEAAAQGLGVTLGAHPLVDPFLEDGRLRCAFDLHLPMSGSYYVKGSAYLQSRPGAVAPAATAIAGFAIGSGTA